MKYYNSVTDDMGYIHSIDMVYVEYFSYVNPKAIIEIVQGIHAKYPALSYQEHLGRSPHSKYDYYLDGIAIGGVYISAGKYNNYDKVTKTFDLLPMFEIRVNPNKHFEEEWFQELLKQLFQQVADTGILRKYDYALDIPKEIKYVKVLDSRKELGIYKGTYYYGQTGRHGYLKIYDKQKDMKRQKEEIGVLTRVEHTIYTAKKPSLENVYVLESEALKNDGKLNDTDTAIVEMYLQLKALGVEYDLRLGRKKKEKLEPYIQGQYKLVEYGDILEKLVENIKQVFKASDVGTGIETDENGFVKVSPEKMAELPFV